MPLACVGLSHHASPLSVRERVAISREEARRLLATLDWNRAAASEVAEVALLSTCNRTEIYVAGDHSERRWSSVPDFARDLLLRSGPPALDEVRPMLYEHLDRKSVEHLCRVACGLDSMVLGESEVLGQVMSACALAGDAGTSGPVLDAAFRTAIRAGRRARAETGIGRFPTSVASETIRLVETLVDPGATPSVVLLGTGQMARLLALILIRRGFPGPTIVGRTAVRAVALARAVGGRALLWHQLPAALHDADVVLSSTAAPHPVVSVALVSEVLRDRPAGQVLHCVDLAVPRDIEPEVRNLPGVSLYDLDDIHTEVTRHVRLREAERPAVETIIEQEINHFEVWRRGLELRSVLAGMHTRGEAIRRQELERFLRRHPAVDDTVREGMEQLSRSIIAKLLHTPSTRLRAEADPGTRRRYAAALQALFELTPPNHRR